MARSHFIRPTTDRNVMAVVLGASTSDTYTIAEVGKFVKLGSVSDSYVLAAAGDEIEAVISSVNVEPTNGRTVGGIVTGDYLGLLEAIADGLQATPGTGTLAVGDIVVVGSVTAKGTALTTNPWPKVCKATTAANVKNRYRVESLQTGAGAAGTRVTIRRV